ncbi:hypothetical protein ACOSQ3_015454 [Xanthoceras sorbifolium]
MEESSAEYSSLEETIFAKICEEIVLDEDEINEATFVESVRKVGECKIALSLMGKVLATSQVNCDAFKGLIDPIWHTIHGVEAEDVGGGGGGARNG